MIKKIVLVALFISFSKNFYSQEISGKVFSKNSNFPIENVSVISNLKTGTTSDADGKYSFSIENIKFLTFSYLGFETKTISLENLKKLKYVVYLSETANQLDEVKITSFVFSLDSILKKTNNSMNEKYIDTIVQQEMYLTINNDVKFDNLAVNVNKSKSNYGFDKKKLQRELDNFTNTVRKENIELSSEFQGILVSKKMELKKSKSIYYHSNFKEISGYLKSESTKKNSIENLTNQLQELILKNINQQETYKVKTGFFKIEDSLTVGKKVFFNDSIPENSFKVSTIGNYKSTAENLASFFKKEDENNFLNTTYYQHSLEKTLLSEDKKIYIISFLPRKSKAKFQGKLFINSEDFTLEKIDVGFADGKRGQHLNLKLLLGVKFEENKHHFTIHYEHFENDNMITSYVKEEKSSYVYMNRPFKFVENSKEKNKIKFSLKVEAQNAESFEILFQNSVFKTKDDLKLKEKNSQKRREMFLSDEEYLKTTWKNRQPIYQYLNNLQ